MTQTRLINGTAGGVGLAAVQFALAAGATVIGTASEGNHEHLRSLGAILTIYGPGLVGRVRELATHGINVPFDAAGSGILPELIEVTGSAGKVITIAGSRAAKVRRAVHRRTGPQPGARSTRRSRSTSSSPSADTEPGALLGRTVYRAAL